MPEFVQTTTGGGVGQVSINRPELHNAFNDEVMHELTAAFEALGTDDAVRAVILQSEGKSFCAGADINWMKRMVDYSFDENVADATIMSNMLRKIRECPKPVIARVHGAAIGGGVGLVAACDMAVSVRKAVYCLSEVKLGILPAVISPFVIEKIGPGTVRRYALTAERFDAEEARRIGLISEVVDTAEELDRAIETMTSSVLKNGPLAVAECKKILAEVGGFDWDHVQKRTTETISRIRVSDEGQEGLRSFLEKRAPSWVSE